ncbi:MAG: thiamine phosphate synthase [Chloracidobacterium sp.]|uniref:Thiamine-phosphate synthase n=1 Tax=Chloracidobacterium validum TaxID=2821543 RepID=A0ABX8BD48_9BACT|nr:thiamine phosphate synthase [Chloracidobacterium validum]QUW03584.1 thiamine phosphate synthase [Chloracidobacterium validum]
MQLHFPTWQLPPVYPITSPSVGHSLPALVDALMAGGATLIQLRDKHADARTLYEAVCAVLALARPRGVRVIVNDRVDIAYAAGADGVHLGQDDLDPRAARALLGPSAVIGYSTHNVAQAVAAEQLPVDYIAIGPVFETQTKANPDPIVGLDGVRRVRAVTTKPLVAIGGIDDRSLTDVRAAGADAVALISTLYIAPDAIPERMAALLALAG